MAKFGHSREESLPPVYPAIARLHTYHVSREYPRAPIEIETFCISVSIPPICVLARRVVSVAVARFFADHGFKRSKTNVTEECDGISKEPTRWRGAFTSCGYKRFSAINY